MRRPKSVKLGGHTVTVHALTEDILTTYRPELIDPMDVTGLNVPRELKIFIAPDLAETMWWEVLFHELLHMIDVGYLGNRLSEQDVCAIGSAIADIMLNNGFLDLSLDKPKKSG